MMVLLVYARAYSTLSRTASWSTLKRSAMSRRRSGRLTSELRISLCTNHALKTLKLHPKINMWKKRIFDLILEKTDFSRCLTYPKDSLGLLMIIVLCLGFDTWIYMLWGFGSKQNLYIYTVYHRH